jgi:hypothetical protein
MFKEINMWFKSKRIRGLEDKGRSHARRLVELETTVKQLTCEHNSVTFGRHMPGSNAQHIYLYYKKCTDCGKVLEEYMYYEKFLKSQMDDLIEKMDKIKSKKKDLNFIKGLCP